MSDPRRVTTPRGETGPTRATSARHALVPVGFRTPAETLARPPAPSFMAWGLWAALGATAVVCLLVLAGPMDETVLAKGLVRPRDYALVYPTEAGVLRSVQVVNGAQVQEGTMLAVLDSWDLDREQVQVQGDLAEAEAREKAAQADTQALLEAPVGLDLLAQSAGAQNQADMLMLHSELLGRLEQLGEGSVPYIDLLRSRLDRKNAEQSLERAQLAKRLSEGPYAAAVQQAALARLEAARARVSLLRERLHLLEQARERRTVRAPCDGVLVASTVRFPGERAELGQVLFKIARGSDAEIRLYASEDRVDRIQVGMLVRFRSLSDPDRLSPLSLGRVRAVAIDRNLESESSALQAPGTWAIDVSVERVSNPLPFGASVDAEIVLNTRPFWRLLLMRSHQQP